MESGNRTKQAFLPLQRQLKLKGLEQFLPRGRREKMKKQGQALWRQPAALLAARHTGADEEEHTTAGKGHPVVVAAHLVSPTQRVQPQQCLAQVPQGTELPPSIPCPWSSVTIWTSYSMVQRRSPEGHRQPSVHSRKFCTCEIQSLSMCQLDNVMSKVRVQR